MDADWSRQSPPWVHPIMATIGESPLVSGEHDTHCWSCHRRRLATWKTRTKMDGVRSGAEERSRLQRFPWHEQIDTTAPPPKCRVLMTEIGRWWGTTEVVNRLPAAPRTLWSPSEPTLPAYNGDAFKTAPGRNIFGRIFPRTWEKQGHLASRQLRYSEGQECLNEASSGLNSPQDPWDGVH